MMSESMEWWNNLSPAKRAIYREDYYKKSTLEPHEIRHIFESITEQNMYKIEKETDRFRHMADGHIWCKLNYKEAAALFLTDMEVFQLYDDGTESVVYNLNEFEQDGTYGIR